MRAREFLTERNNSDNNRMVNRRHGRAVGLGLPVDFFLGLDYGRQLRHCQRRRVTDRQQVGYLGLRDVIAVRAKACRKRRPIAAATRSARPYWQRGQEVGLQDGKVYSPS